MNGNINRNWEIRYENYEEKRFLRGADFESRGFAVVTESRFRIRPLARCIGGFDWRKQLLHVCFPIPLERDDYES